MAYKATIVTLGAATPSAPVVLTGAKSCSVTLDDRTALMHILVSSDGSVPTPSTDPEAEIPAGASWSFDFGPYGLPVGQTIQFTIESSKATTAIVETSS
jgi:hypothetical protein